MSSASPIILYDILPDVNEPGKRPYALLPNPWITRLVLKLKRIPFVVKPITTTELHSKGPDSFRERLGVSIGAGERPHIPAIEHNGRLIADTMTIADYLDAQFPDTPNSYIPELTTVEANKNPRALTFALDAARVARNTAWTNHAELGYEQLTELLDREQQDWFRSKEKLGAPGAYESMLEIDRGPLLAAVRRFIAGYFSVLQSSQVPRIEGLAPNASPAEVSALLNQPPTSSEPRLFVGSNTQPGFVDFTFFAWYLFTYTCDRALNEAIWSKTSTNARAWLDTCKDGKWALKGSAREPGYWAGDIELEGLEEWADRMMSIFDNYPKRILDGEHFEGEPQTS
ncbi:hypothetical protein OC845_000383 [Tilletia horrida]|nr:hypothetical protein OC845_000383 [Tilletia horrida]